MTLQRPDDDLREYARLQRILAETTNVLLDYTGQDEVEPLRRVVCLVAESFGDWCAFSLVDEADGLVKPVAGHHPDEHQRQLAERVWATMPPARWDAEPHELNALVLGRSVLLERITDAMLSGLPTEELRGLYADIGLTSVLTAPMRSGGRPLGLLILASTAGQERRFTPRDIELAEAIASRASLAVRNARLSRDLARERDVAARRAAELEAVLGAHPSGVMIYGADDRLRYVSPAIARMSVIDPTALIGRHFSEVMATDVGDGPAPESLTGRLPSVFADRTASREDDLEFAIGGVRRVLRRLTVPVTASGEYVGRLFLYEDVTSARDLDRQRRDFLSVAAHELRTPLTSVSLYLQTAGRRLEAGQQVDATLVSRALRQTERLGGLIDDLLNLSRLDSGRLQLALEAVGLDALVAEVLGDLQVDDAHELVIVSSGEELTITADAPRVAQVLVNLVTNAFKYSPRGGRVVVEVRRRGAEAEVSVTDEGIGVPTEELAHLFEPFFRARNAAQSSFGGLGVGLYISHEIVRRHGGRFEVVSSEGRGSTFRFSLPLAEAGTRPARPRILLVDDDRDIIDALAGALDDAGYEVLTAVNASRALDLLAEGRPDAMLVDLMMPLVDGAEFLASARARGLVRMPVLLISAGRDLEERARELEVDGFIRKPLQLGPLLTTIARLLERRAA